MIDFYAEMERRRPGITRIMDDLKDKYPHMSQAQIEAQAKEIWHELNPKVRE